MTTEFIDLKEMQTAEEALSLVRKGLHLLKQYIVYMSLIKKGILLEFYL